jgi:hypothetical protein
MFQKREGRGGTNIVFGPKYRPLLFCSVNFICPPPPNKKKQPGEEMFHGFKKRHKAKMESGATRCVIPKRNYQKKTTFYFQL